MYVNIGHYFIIAAAAAATTALILRLRLVSVTITIIHFGGTSINIYFFALQ
jgi:hypothetical protein